MRFVLIFIAVLSFLNLLATSLLTGFDAVPLATGGVIALASFLLGLVSVGTLFADYGNGDD